MESQKISYTRTTESMIILGNDILKQTAAKISRLRASRHCAIVTNATIAKWYLQPLVAELRTRGVKTEEIVIEDGEGNKSFELATELINRFCELRLDRDCPVIALGGGVITDLVGFCASIFKRGVPLVLIPTSLTAMVDSSLGGKNGVNLKQGKNLAGTINQPELVAIDTSTLKTLPLSQLSYGIIEALKHGAIADRAYFKFILKNCEAIKAKNQSLLQRLIRRSIYIKKSFVTDDELDNNIRFHLNFGHTFGHALEASGNYVRLHHGEAVGLGMLMALKAAANEKILEEDYSESLKYALKEFSLPVVFPPDINKKDIIAVIKQDKKKKKDCHSFVLPVKLGKTIIYEISNDKLEQFLKSTFNI